MKYARYTLWYTNTTMENRHFLWALQINYKWLFSVAMFVYQRVTVKDWFQGYNWDLGGWAVDHRWPAEFRNTIWCDEANPATNIFFHRWVFKNHAYMVYILI